MLQHSTIVNIGIHPTMLLLLLLGYYDDNYDDDDDYYYYYTHLTASFPGQPV